MDLPIYSARLTQNRVGPKQESGFIIAAENIGSVEELARGKSEELKMELGHSTNSHCFAIERMEGSARVDKPGVLLILYHS